MIYVGGGKKTIFKIEMLISIDLKSVVQQVIFHFSFRNSNNVLIKLTSQLFCYLTLHSIHKMKVKTTSRGRQHSQPTVRLFVYSNYTRMFPKNFKLSSNVNKSSTIKSRKM